jgi:D-beta-D-heptose 7-phosphate kinase/D-beta-D-heptose 1-phosphate adenosyltransferase
MDSKRIVSLSNIKATANRLRRGGRKLVFTNGVFDILHRGHVDYLAKAKSFGDDLIVGLNTDVSVRRLKGKGRPVQKERDRAAVLLALRSVDYVVMFSADTPAELIRRVRPDILVKGADYEISEIIGADFVRSYGGQVRRIRLTPGRSTTRILKDAQSK